MVGIERQEEQLRETKSRGVGESLRLEGFLYHQVTPPLMAKEAVPCGGKMEVPPHWGEGNIAGHNEPRGSGAELVSPTTY